MLQLPLLSGYNSKDTLVATAMIHWLQLIKKHLCCNHKKIQVQLKKVIATYDIF
jgi:hypothetical protein